MVLTQVPRMCCWTGNTSLYKKRTVRLRKLDGDSCCDLVQQYREDAQVMKVQTDGATTEGKAK